MVGKIILGFFIVIVLAFGLTWIGMGNQLFLNKVFGVPMANVQRQIFEQSNSYNRGKIQNLIKYMDEYRTADAEGKEAIKQFVKQDYADYDESRPQSNLSTEMKSFLRTCKYN